MDKPRLFTVKEVAELLRKGVQMVRLDIKNGKLKAIKEGRKWLVEDGEVYSKIIGK